MKKIDLSRIFLASLFLTASGIIPVHSQDIEWEKSYGGKHADYLFDAIPTADYGFILAGSSLSRKSGNKTEDGEGNLDYWVWKMDEKGELDWQKSFGGSGSDLLQSVRNTKDGGFILGGTSDSGKGLQKKDTCRGASDIWIIKLNAKGGEEWQRTLGGSGQELLQAVVPSSDGGYIVAGSSASEQSQPVKGGTDDPFGKASGGFGNLDYWVVKLDAKGNVAWQQTLGGIYSDQVGAAIPTKDGGCLIGGSSNSPESGSKTEKNYGENDYWVIKLDRNGAVEWQKSYGGEGDDQLHAMEAAHDGNFILAGSSNSGSTGNKNSSNKKGTDFWLVKIDTAGEILWQETYDIGKVDLLVSVVENKDHTLLLGGYAQSEAKGKKKDAEGVNDYAVIKADAEGKELWTQTAGSGGEDILRRAVETRDGGYLLAGTSSGAVSRDRYTGKGRQDFWVVKLRDKDKKKEEKKPIEAFPNPTQQFTNVVVGYEFQKGTATVYDLGGRQLQHFDIESSTVPVDLGGLPVGIYLVEIRTNVQKDAVKVVKSLNKN